MLDATAMIGFNLIFVGRVAPHKHQEDIIRAFAWYKKHLNPKSRLFLVGSGNTERYNQRLSAYVEALGVQDVIFPGTSSSMKSLPITTWPMSLSA